MAEKEAIEEAQSKLRSKFLQVLRSRRQDESLVWLRCRTPDEENPCRHNYSPTKEEMEIMESCPKADTENLGQLLQEENIYLISENDYYDGVPYEIFWLNKTPITALIVKLKESDKQRKRPAVVFLHGMNKDKESLRPLLKAYASRGYVAISMDACHHGECTREPTGAFRDAVIYSWNTAQRMPFIYDTAYALTKLADYLTKRVDIDPSRIGITGIDLGGMHAWFAAVADPRYAVVVPLIGVLGFRWVIDNDKWKDQCAATKLLFEVARHNLGKSLMDKEAQEKAWERLAPGLTSEFDSPYSIPAIAPRPLLIINGAEDPECPIASLEVTKAKAREAYEAFQCLDNFKFIAEPGVGHQLTKFQVKETSDWFDKFLKP